jgi:hypothetical protein
MSGLIERRPKIPLPPLWGKVAEGRMGGRADLRVRGTRSHSPRSARPPSLTLPHKGGGDAVKAVLLSSTAGHSTRFVCSFPARRGGAGWSRSTIRNSNAERFDALGRIRRRRLNDHPLHSLHQRDARRDFSHVRRRASCDRVVVGSSAVDGRRFHAIASELGSHWVGWAYLAGNHCSRGSLVHPSRRSEARFLRGLERPNPYRWLADVLAHVGGRAPRVPRMIFAGMTRLELRA